MSSGHEGYSSATTSMFGTGEIQKTSRLGGPEAWTIWILATLFVVWLFAIQTGYGIVSPEIQESAGLSIAEIGLAASIYAWVFAGVQFFSGSLLDRFGTRPLLWIAVALVTAGAFLYAATTNFATLILAQIVLAIGSSFGFVGAGYVGSKWFVAARYGLMFGLVQMFASLGSAVSQPAISALLDEMSWQAVLGGFGAFGVLLTLGVMFIVRNPVSTPEEIAAQRAARAQSHLFRDIFHDLGACFRNPRIMLSALFAGASFGTILAIGVLWGPRVQMARGATDDFAATLSALMWLGVAVGAPLVNVVSNRWNSRKWPAVLGMALQTLAVVLFLYAPWTSMGATAVVMLAVGVFGGTHMLGFTIAGESASRHLIGSAAAIVNGVCFIVAGALQAVPGRLLPESPDLADYQSALWILPAALVAGFVVTLVLRERPQAVVN